jgi:hypothetical protein
MSTAKHTPGPWSPACKTNSATHRHPAILCDSGQVANATFQGSEYVTDANANLISAAPELLEVAEGILVDDMLQYLPDEYIAKVRAAIAKARGD